MQKVVSILYGMRRFFYETTYTMSWYKFCLVGGLTWIFLHLDLRIDDLFCISKACFYRLLFYLLPVVVFECKWNFRKAFMEHEPRLLGTSWGLDRSVACLRVGEEELRRERQSRSSSL